MDTKKVAKTAGRVVLSLTVVAGGLIALAWAAVVNAPETEFGYLDEFND